MKQFERIEKYEVIKLDDIEKYLTSAQKLQLEQIVGTIQKGRGDDGKQECNRYVIVNEEELYANIVWGLVEMGEALKQKLDPALIATELVCLQRRRG